MRGYLKNHNQNKSMKIKTKILLQFVLILVLFSIAISLILNYNIREYVVNQKLSSDLNLGLSLLDTKYPGEWTLKDNFIYKGETKLNNNFEIVDSIKKSTGSVATIFMLDENNTYIQDEENAFVRISTNIMVENKSKGEEQWNGKAKTMDEDITYERAVGTKLGTKVKNVIVKGEDFKGEASILGTNYLSHYIPIRDNNDKIIGIWFVGISEEFVSNEVGVILGEMMLVMVIGIVLAIILISILTGRMIQDINAIQKTLKEVENGNYTASCTVKSKDEIGSLCQSFGALLESIRYRAELAKRISNGEEGIEVEVKSENDLLGIGLKGVVDNNKILRKEIIRLATEAGNGNLKLKIDSSHFNGSWKRLVNGLNALVKKVDQPISQAGIYIDKMANGEYIGETDLDKYSGDFKTLMENITKIETSLKTLHKETALLIREAIKGNLSYRADIMKLKGIYKNIVSGINNALDATNEPVKEASIVLQNISNGDLDSRVEGDYQGDHAQIKYDLNFMGETLQGYINEISNVLYQMADKNFNVGIDREYVGDFTKLKESINNIINQFNFMLAEINSSVEQVEAASEQVASSSQDLSQGASEQASSVDQISSSITEISNQTNQNAEYANKAYELSVDVKNIINNGNKQMSETLESMNEIKEASENISKIIKVIEDIAFQTNILALNAAVEAARAGEHGKGFAVVADEVRNLATKSASATKETAKFIENTIVKVNEGYKSSNTTAKAFERILVGIDETVEISERIARSSNEQATAISQIEAGIERVSQVTQNTSSTAEESASSSEEMAVQSQRLKEMIEEFKLKTDKKLLEKEEVHLLT